MGETAMCKFFLEGKKWKKEIAAAVNPETLKQ